MSCLRKFLLLRKDWTRGFPGEGFSSYGLRATRPVYIVLGEFSPSGFYFRSAANFYAASTQRVVYGIVKFHRQGDNQQNLQCRARELQILQNY